MAKPIKFRSLKNYLVEHVAKDGSIYWVVTDLTKKTNNQKWKN